MLSEAEDALLAFWLISGGGGAGGDKAIANEFFSDGQSLDAAHLSGRLQKVIGRPLDLTTSKKLLQRIYPKCAASDASTAVVSAEALCKWIRRRHPVYQFEQFFASLRLDKTFARHVVQARVEGTSFDDLCETLTYEEILAKVPALFTRLRTLCILT